MFKFLSILVIAVIAAKAYDFQDLYFNQLLYDEYQTLNVDDVDIERQRLDRKKDFLCCTGDKFDPEHYKMIKETKKQCAMKLRANNSDVENFDVFDCEKMTRIKQLIICEGDCYSKTMNILDESGILKREVIIKHLSEHLLSDSEWKKTAYEAYVDKCLAKVAAEIRQANQKCNSSALEFHHCMWVEFMNGCPVDLRIDTPQCNKMRESHGQGTDPVLNKNVFNEF